MSSSTTVHSMSLLGFLREGLLAGVWALLSQQGHTGKSTHQEQGLSHSCIAGAPSPSLPSLYTPVPIQGRI